jgi:hypothetical protein
MSIVVVVVVVVLSKIWGGKINLTHIPQYNFNQYSNPPSTACIRCVRSPSITGIQYCTVQYCTAPGMYDNRTANTHSHTRGITCVHTRRRRPPPPPLSRVIVPPTLIEMRYTCSNDDNNNSKFQQQQQQYRQQQQQLPPMALGILYSSIDRFILCCVVPCCVYSRRS